MSPRRRDDESDVADRLRPLYFWLFIAAIVGGLWMYADARSVSHVTTTLPSPRFPTTQPAYGAALSFEMPGEESLSASDGGDVE